MQVSLLGRLRNETKGVHQHTKASSKIHGRGIPAPPNWKMWWWGDYRCGAPLPLFSLITFSQSETRSSWSKRNKRTGLGLVPPLTDLLPHLTTQNKLKHHRFN